HFSSRCHPYAGASSEDLDLESMANLETLPPELLWKILHFAPGSVFDLRLTSKTLKYRVEEYALQRDYIIEKLIILDKNYRIIGTSAEYVAISEGERVQAHGKRLRTTPETSRASIQFEEAQKMQQ
ncbi:hypothetical protein PMAYCL1PPCAC_31789, partial [Pristionchus mayeri]